MNNAILDMIEAQLKRGVKTKREVMEENKEMPNQSKPEQPMIVKMPQSFTVHQLAEIAAQLECELRPTEDGYISLVPHVTDPTL